MMTRKYHVRTVHVTTGLAKPKYEVYFIIDGNKDDERYVTTFKDEVMAHHIRDHLNDAVDVGFDDGRMYQSQIDLEINGGTL